MPTNLPTRRKMQMQPDQLHDLLSAIAAGAILAFLMIAVFAVTTPSAALTSNW